MNKTVMFIFLIFSTLFLQSCTIGNYEIRNKLHLVESPEDNEQCDFKFYILLSSAHMTNTLGIREHNEDVLLASKEKYIESTKIIFNKYGCKANNVETEQDANFKIRVVRFKNISALPQEWLTGLSFGLIPSWGTREKVFEYSFNEVSKNRLHDYYIDEHTYNHILLFPIFWINFISIDEHRIYKETLANFIESVPNKINTVDL